MTNEFNDLKPKTEFTKEELNEIYEEGKRDYQKIVKALDQHRFVRKFNR
ncbi:MAG: hypothetical protein GTN40_05720 [Candidatus Aenigmarchaeota archaeon]|nr:hypothetical protein [Candidatus Aenigmarchaeota archaeon]